ncbi:MAG: L-seryl-tRNA(Sec) selenium transferase [Acidobacteriota bacterium]
MSDEPETRLLRRLPAVGRLVNEDWFADLTARYPQTLVTDELQGYLEELRSAVRAGRLAEQELENRLDRLPEVVGARLASRMECSLRPVINATGIILFTNAGRAPLAPSALDRVRVAAAGYSNLEFDLDRDRRGRRDSHVEHHLVRLLATEAATVVNNAAAALVLILNTLARDQVVLVSRGELIEIGGSFRLPEVMEAGGARLREVGTTNRTHLRDYERAIDEETALILRVHPSNYRVVGFTTRPGLGELADLAHRHGLPLVHDAGSGLLFRDPHPALRDEPAVAESLAAGADLVCFSGDKLLGGPQAGVIAGRADLVQRLRKNPLMRALRVDKLTLAALEATLLEYVAGTYRRHLPVWRMLYAQPEAIRERADQVVAQLGGSGLELRIVPGESYTGGGSAPEEALPTWLVEVGSATLSASRIEERLRLRRLPVLCRVSRERVLLDLRTVFPEEDTELVAALREATE